MHYRALLLLKLANFTRHGKPWDASVFLLFLLKFYSSTQYLVSDLSNVLLFYPYTNYAQIHLNKFKFIFETLDLGTVLRSSSGKTSWVHILSLRRKTFWNEERKGKKIRKVYCPAICANSFLCTNDITYSHSKFIFSTTHLSQGGSARRIAGKLEKQKQKNENFSSIVFTTVSKLYLYGGHFDSSIYSHGIF